MPLDFRYILTAANRWANGQIDDFTLIIDMETLETIISIKPFLTEQKIGMMLPFYI